MKVLTISVTEPGRRIAERLPYEHAHGEPAATLAARWGDVDAFVMVLALGAVVRLIAPLLTDKATDPAVVCVDDAGTFAVSVCGGHAGGANGLAEELGGLIGATPVVTTATDRLDIAALDLLPGFRADGNVAHVTAALLAGEPVTVRRDLDWPLPVALADQPSRSPDADATTVVVSDRVIELGSKAVALRPPSLVVGVGTTSDATESELRDAVDESIRAAGLVAGSVSSVASIDRRAGHRAVTALTAALRADLRTFAAAQLDAVTVPTPSPVVADAVGTRSVAEAAALLAAGDGAALVLPKVVTGRVTVAIARRARPRGLLAVVGLGPGALSHRTPEAARAVRHAEVVVGLDAYVDQCADLLTPAHDVRRFAIGAELERVRLALELAAAGRRVALVCSGDAGVYAMASPTLELADAAHGPGFADVEIEVVPGVTAGLAASAALGAPLGHDFLTLSLSDLLTPWERIEARVRAAAETDLVLVLYNPRSARRTWQIEKARSILLEHRSPDTPVGVVTDVARPAERISLTTLGDLDLDAVNMTTCLIVGSSTTVVVNGRMVTPRGYPT